MAATWQVYKRLPSDVSIGSGKIYSKSTSAPFERLLTRQPLEGSPSAPAPPPPAGAAPSPGHPRSAVAVVSAAAAAVSARSRRRALSAIRVQSPPRRGKVDDAIMRVEQAPVARLGLRVELLETAFCTASFAASRSA